MIRRRFGTLLAALALSLAGGTVVSAAPAQAGTFTCGAAFFLKSAQTQQYLSIEPISGALMADRSYKGWWEQFRLCRDSSWNAAFSVIKSDALSSTNRKDSYLRKDGVRLVGTAEALNGNNLFEWVGNSTYGRLKHAESRTYLTVESTYPYLGLTTTVPSQALFRES